MDRNDEHSVAERDEMEAYLVGMLDDRGEIELFRTVWKAFGVLDVEVGLTRRQETLVALTEIYPLKDILSEKRDGLDLIATGRWLVSPYSIKNNTPEEYAELGRALFVYEAFWGVDSKKFDDYVDYECYGRDRVRERSGGFLSERFKRWVDCPGSWFFETNPD